MDDAEFEELLEQSSLGAPHVKAAQGEIPPEVEEQLRRASWTKEMGSLLALHAPTGEQLRRIAEVAGCLFGVGGEVDRVWWEKAAAAGDQDAIDWLKLDEKSNE